MIVKIIQKGTKFLLLPALVLLGAFGLGVLWPLDTVEPIVTQEPVAIIDVAVIDLDSGQVRTDQTIVIQHKRVHAVGSASEVVIPENAIHIEARGRYAIPSLWDMHTHIFKITPLLDMPLYIAFGVTNVRDMSSCPKEGDPFVACPGDFRDWTNAAINDQMVGPRIQSVASWHLNGPVIHDHLKDLPPFFGAENADQARAFIRYYAGKVDAIKMYNHLSKEAYYAAVDEANKLGLDVIGHRPYAISAVEAATHQKSIEHARFILHESFSGSAQLRALAESGQWSEDRRRMLDEHKPEMASAIFAAMKASGTWYVPTHLTRRVDAYGEDPVILQDPLLRYMHFLLQWQWLEDVNKVIDEDPSPEARQTYRDFYYKGLELTGAAHRAGVKVLAGTDYIVAGATVHDELKELVKAGLSPLDALRSATALPAQYFDMQEEFGGIKAGMVADLIILSRNPLDDISHTQSIETVIFNGNIYDHRTLNEIKNRVEKRARSWTLACKIIWEFIKNPQGY